MPEREYGRGVSATPVLPAGPLVETSVGALPVLAAGRYVASSVREAAHGQSRPGP